VNLFLFPFDAFSISEISPSLLPENGSFFLLIFSVNYFAPRFFSLIPFFPTTALFFEQSEKFSACFCFF